VAALDWEAISLFGNWSDPNLVEAARWSWALPLTSWVRAACSPFKLSPQKMTPCKACEGYFLLTFG